MSTDAAVVAVQLGRPPRGLREVAHRCPCGLPDVVETAPRLADGTPFPTLLYLTCPRAVAAVSRLEAAGVMRRMQDRLATDAALRAAYQAAHRDYLARRDAAARAAGVTPLPPGTQSAGGMPDRVKCLHALVAHELAAPGANPLGREAAAAAGSWWAMGPCVDLEGTPQASDGTVAPGARSGTAGDTGADVDDTPHTSDPPGPPVGTPQVPDPPGPQVGTAQVSDPPGPQVGPLEASEAPARGADS